MISNDSLRLFQESLFHDAEIIEEPIEEMNDRKICFKFHPESKTHARLFYLFIFVIIFVLLIR